MRKYVVFGLKAWFGRAIARCGTSKVRLPTSAVRTHDSLLSMESVVQIDDGNSINRFASIYSPEHHPI
mgnify:CR=1 FL=1